ncbi:hypothetical protein Tco_1450820 [Tanacetum coccineum]
MTTGPPEAVLEVSSPKHRLEKALGLQVVLLITLDLMSLSYQPISHLRIAKVSCLLAGVGVLVGFCVLSGCRAKEMDG